jgi:hypothetical protein
MKCVICNTKDADNMIPATSKDSVVCMLCRRERYPSHMRADQYKRYWVAFNKKYIERSKDGKESS